jgi:hypothetical protein
MMFMTSEVIGKLHDLQTRLQSDPALKTHNIIANLSFMRDIEKAHSPDDFECPTNLLLRIERDIQAKDSPCDFYFPAHLVKQNHWICLRISFDSQTIAYGVDFVT